MRAISSAIFIFWRMWTSKPVTNVQVRKHALVIVVINPLVHIYQKEKIVAKNRSYEPTFTILAKCFSSDNCQLFLSLLTCANSLGCCWCAHLLHKVCFVIFCYWRPTFGSTSASNQRWVVVNRRKSGVKVARFSVMSSVLIVRQSSCFSLSSGEEILQGQVVQS
jgi:hypothetical protein